MLASTDSRQALAGLLPFTIAGRAAGRGSRALAAVRALPSISTPARRARTASRRRSPAPPQVAQRAAALRVRELTRRLVHAKSAAIGFRGCAVDEHVPRHKHERASPVGARTNGRALCRESRPARRLTSKGFDQSRKGKASKSSMVRSALSRLPEEPSPRL